MEGLRLAVKKPTAKPRPREIQHEADRIRRLNVPLATQWYVAAGELAARLGMKPGDVLEMFAEMAHVYTYDGSTREVAEVRAWSDTVAILERQRRAAS